MPNVARKIKLNKALSSAQWRAAQKLKWARKARARNVKYGVLFSSKSATWIIYYNISSKKLGWISSRIRSKQN